MSIERIVVDTECLYDLRREVNSKRPNYIRNIESAGCRGTLSGELEMSSQIVSPPPASVHCIKFLPYH